MDTSKFVCLADFEQPALRHLNQNVREYFRSGADDEVTLANNQDAFKRWIIRPRVLRDVSHGSLSTTVLGNPVPFPVGVAPMGLLRLCHEEGELALARAAATLGMIYTLSTMSTCSLEEVAAAAGPGARLWFQLYVCKERALAEQLVRRAEAAGFEALVLTVDAPLYGRRRSNLRNSFQLPPHLRLTNFELSKSMGFKEVIDRVMDQSLSWADFDWLRGITKLPIVVKGILTAEDARLAVEHGAAAVFISNHGGRQLDTTPATVDVLEEVVHAVNGRCEVYMDSGIRNGSDIFKALALGANMAFVGRPFLWGLAIGGQVGAKRVGEILREELELVMSLSGVANVHEIDNSYVRRLSYL